MSDRGTIRVSVVSTDPGWLLQLAEALADFETRTYQSTAAAIAEIEHGDPGVVVVAPSEAEQFLAQPAHETPRAAVVLVVPETTVELLRQAMFAGIGDVVSADRLADLPDAVRDQHGRLDRFPPTDDGPAVPRAPRRGTVVVVTAAKAGQGATTVAANLAVTLAGRGRVALVEGDPRYGDVLSAFGYRQSRTELVRADDVVGDHWLGRYLYRHPTGVLLAIPRPDTTPAILQPDLALDALTALQAEVDTVVLDLPLVALESYGLLRAVDEVLLVSTDRFRDLAHARTAARQITHPQDRTRLVVSTYVDGRTPKRSAMATVTGLTTVGRIPETAEADEALTAGRPIVATAPDGPVAAAFRALADHLAELVPAD